MTSFFVEQDGLFRATPLTRGPWDERFQHGGPPCALLADGIALLGDDAEQWFTSRITYHFVRPVPIAPLRRVVTLEHPGRSVQRVRACLYAGDKLVLDAIALRSRIHPSPVSTPPPWPWPPPDDLPSVDFDFFVHEVGYHQAVEFRIAHGAWSDTIGCWARVKVPLVAEQSSQPLARLIVLVDAQSGVCPPVDPQTYSYANPDLTVYLFRPPSGEWFGLDSKSFAGADGIGLTRSDLADSLGPLGASAQSLWIQPR